MRIIVNANTITINYVITIIVVVIIIIVMDSFSTTVILCKFHLGF